MAKQYQIEVTPQDIAAGDRASPCGCPVALAICRALDVDPELGEIDVDADGVYLDGGRGFLRRASGRLPPVARRFIADFDARQDVAPISFRLGIRKWFSGA